MLQQTRIGDKYTFYMIVYTYIYSTPVNVTALTVSNYGFSFNLQLLFNENLGSRLVSMDTCSSSTIETGFNTRSETYYFIVNT